MEQLSARQTVGDAAAPPDWLTVGMRFGVLEVAGEFDNATAATVTAALEPLLVAGGPIRIDLRAVTFMGSAGFHVLEDAAASVRGRGRVIVLDASRVVVRAFALIGLSDEIEVVPPIRRCDVVV